MKILVQAGTVTRVVAICGMALAFCRLAQATEYRVPDDGDLVTVVALANADQAATKITVAANTYELSATLEITGAYSLESASGKPTDVVIKPASKKILQPAVKISNAGATLAGVTVRGGAGSGVFNNHMGGNVYNAGGTVTNCCLINCDSSKVACGGGIVNDNGLVTDCVITNNCPSSGGYGNGVVMKGADAVLENCLIAENVAGSRYDAGGGGVYALGGTIRGCVIRNNVIYHPVIGNYYTGGGVYIPSGATVTMTDCLVADNVSGASNGGGGIYMGGTANCVISNSTIVGNKSGKGYAGVYLASACTVANTIIWDNYLAAPSSLQPFAEELTTSKTGNFRNVCTKGGYGTDALTSDPLFVDPAHGDYRLSVASPCQAAGCGWGAKVPTKLTVCFPPTNRLVKAGAVSIPVSVLAAAGTVSFRYRLDTVGGAEGTWSTWGGDATYADTLAVGRYTLRVEANDGVTTASDALKLDVCGATTYLVPAGTAGNTPNPPYATPETAANTFADALAFCPDGGTLLMADGAYPVTERQRVRRAVAIKAAHGPAKTSLYRKGPAGASPSFGVLRLENPAASLEGLTVSNGCYLIEMRNHDLGSGLWSFGASISNCVFELNKTRDDGMSSGSPAVACLHGTIRDSIVRGNVSAGGYGGGLYLRGETALAVDCVISNNYHSGYSTGSGMGVYLAGGKLLRCRIVDNRNNAGGGSGAGAGVQVGAGNSEIRNCLLAKNKAGAAGGAIRIADNISAKVVNCTIADNEALNGAGVSGGANSGSYTFVNNLFWGNSDTVASPAAGQPTWHGINKAKGSYLTNAVPDAAAQYGATDFTIAVPGFETGGYALTLASEARDKGNRYDWTDADIDLAHNPRLGKGVVDCGAYEFVASQELTAEYSISRHDIAGAKIICTATVDGVAEYSCRWTFVDVATGVTNDWSAWTASSTCELAPQPGRYRILLQVTDGTKTISYEDGNDYCIVSPQVYLVDAARRTGAPAYPFSSWQTAAESLQEALTACGHGTVLTAGPGWFGVTEEIVLGKGIKIRSSDGPDVTSVYAIRGSGEQRRVITLQHADAELCGLTVSNGYLDISAGGAGVICRDGALISNCVVRANGLTYRSGGPLSVLNARAVDCVVTGHSNGDSKGSGLYISGADARATRIRIFGNKNPGYYDEGCCVVCDGALLEDSLVVSNDLGSTSGSHCGGLKISGGARAKNCLVAFNSGGSGPALVAQGPGSVENCTFVSNAVMQAGVPVSIKVSGVETSIKGYSLVVSNSVFYANTGVEDAPEVVLGSYTKLGLSHTLLRDATTFDPAADACFYADPKFRKFDPAARKFDFRLASGSPCINAGCSDAVMRGMTDLLGNPRVVGSAVDLGCYEYPCKGLSIFFR